MSFRPRTPSPQPSGPSDQTQSRGFTPSMVRHTDDDDTNPDPLGIWYPQGYLRVPRESSFYTLPHPQATAEPSPFDSPTYDSMSSSAIALGRFFQDMYVSSVYLPLTPPIERSSAQGTPCPRSAQHCRIREDSCLSATPPSSGLATRATGFRRLDPVRRFLAPELLRLRDAENNSGSSNISCDRPIDPRIATGGWFSGNQTYEMAEDHEEEEGEEEGEGKEENFDKEKEWSNQTYNTWYASSSEWEQAEDETEIQELLSMLGEQRYTELSDDDYDDGSPSDNSCKN